MTALELDKNRLFKHSLKVDLSQKFKTLKGARGSSPIRQNTSLFFWHTKWECRFGNSSPLSENIVSSHHTIICRRPHRTYVGTEFKIPPDAGGVFLIYLYPFIGMNHLDQ